jgi:hypothetical protein
MSVEHILALVAFIVIVLTLSLLLPTNTQKPRAAGGSEAGTGATGAWLADGGGSACAADGGGGCDGGGDGD